MIYTVILSISLAILALLIIPPFIIMPVMARFKMRMAADPGLVKMDPRYFPKYVAQSFAKISDTLKHIGFKVCGDALDSEKMVDETGYFRLFINREAGDMAVAIISLAGSGNKKRVSNAYVEFCTEFPGGRGFATNNNGTPNTFKPVPERKIIRFRKEKDLHRLYSIHQRESSCFGGDAKRILPQKGKELDYLTEALVNELDRQVKTGYLYLDKSSYRPTWKGAFLMAWKSIFGMIRMKYRRS